MTEQSSGAVAALIETYKELKTLRDETEASALLDEYKDIREVTLSTVMGLEMAILIVETKIAVLTGDTNRLIELLNRNPSEVFTRHGYNV